MSFPSKYDGKCKDCGETHKVNDHIAKNSNDNWCRNGMSCKFANTPKLKEPPQVSKPTQPDNFVTYINKQVCTLQEIETIVKDKLGSGAVDVKIGMFVKEIYRQQKLRENNT